MRGYAEEPYTFGQLFHSREPYDVDNQVTVRGNRDTLYSFGVFRSDVAAYHHAAGDRGRYQSLMVVNQDHSLAAAYSPNVVTLEENVGTRYVMLTVRTFMNPNDAADVQRRTGFRMR
ncbi:MAG: hypothetical protein JKP98_18920 [Rhodobacteraceae bacterium]|nr:hypothetical protein [Paracoccaceae bacterium]